MNGKIASSSAKMSRRKKGKKRVFNAKLVFVIVGVIIVFTSYVFFHFSLQPSNVNNDDTFPFKAAIIDHLSISQPNQTFVQSATSILGTAGFTVDYFESEEVTVDFFRDLPLYGYGLIVLRVHSTEFGSFFTSELYSKTKYVQEQLTDQLIKVAFSPEDLFNGGPVYFGIPPKFVKTSMNGMFENTIIIMMGCSGLKDDDMALAFVMKGVKVYIGWDGLISTFHTDQAAILLLQHLVITKQKIELAVETTMEEVGPDPEYGSRLRYSPPVMGEYTIP